MATDKVDAVVLAWCALQNFVLTHRTLAYTIDSNAYVRDGTWRAMARGRLGDFSVLRGGVVVEDAKAIRER